MIVGAIDKDTVLSAVELGCRAPSIHNSQPWRWRRGHRDLVLLADLTRWLPVTDADGRDLMLSCGAVLHHTRIALAAAGVHTTVRRFPDAERRDQLAALEFTPAAPADTDGQLAAAIARRRTDRRRFSTWPVPASMLSALTERAAEQGALLRPVTGPAAATLAAALRHAAAVQDRTPGYATETALWTGGEPGDDGIPAANLLSAAPDPTQGRRFPAGWIDEPDAEEPDGALLVVIGTASDDPMSQLRAGEALSAVTLHATTFGLASCPLSQVLEVGDTRRTLRDDALDGAMSPQLVLRLGFAPPAPLPATPRRPVDEVLFADAG